MTEKEWLEGRRLWPAWTLLTRGIDARKRRKMRLFLVACCRQIWHIITDSRCRRVIELAERCADGFASAEELAAARDGIRARKHRVTAGNLARLVANEYSGMEVSRMARRLLLRHEGVELFDEASEAPLEMRQMELLRDIFANPFRPLPSIDPAWREWHEAIIARLAASIYAERSFERLPILADALEEAGCTDTDLLGHLRGPGPHTRGCWALDLVIGME